ncbi:MAG: YhfX family PLP-dependent enzyme, partial [Enterovibrio sp.]
GGHYRRSLLHKALVNDDVVDVHLPDPVAIDYHFKLSGLHPIGAPVIMSFRTQIFVTRSHVALLTGVRSGNPTIIGRYDSQGRSL